jgi:hypothetical protein
MPRTSAKDELLARIDADIAKLQQMRDYVTAQVPQGTGEDKPKRTRKRKAAPEGV